MEIETKSCQCVNVQFQTYENQVEIKDIPNHMLKHLSSYGWSSKSICVDTCLKDEILNLWEQGITTTGCCCGHNIETSFSYIGVVDSDIPKMKYLGYKVQMNRTDPTREDSFKPKTIFL